MWDGQATFFFFILILLFIGAVAYLRCIDSKHMHAHTYDLFSS